MPNLQVENIDVQKLKVHDKNPKQHSKKQITQIAQSIKEFGFVSPILADEQLEIIAGHGRLAAAKTLGFTQVPVIILSHLTTQQKIAYAIANNVIHSVRTSPRLFYKYLALVYLSPKIVNRLLNGKIKMSVRDILDKASQNSNFNNQEFLFS